MNNRIRMNFIIALLALFFIFPGICIVHASKINNVEINNVDKKISMDYVINDLLNLGYNLITVNDYQVVVKKDAETFAEKFLYGSRYNMTPEKRITLSFIQIDKTLKISAETRMITNPNSSFEKSDVLEESNTQKLLERFKYLLEARNEKIKNELFYGFKYADTLSEGNVFISDITHGGNADKAGLKVGDKVVKINDILITHLVTFTSYLNNPSGSRIKLTIKMNDGKEKDIEIERQ